MASLPCDRRLYLTADKSEIVEHGDPRAAFLFCAADRDLSADQVAEYDLALEGGKIVWPGMKQAAKPEDKMAAKPEDKAAPEPEEEVAAPEWQMSMDPEDYLDRWPKGPNAELARQVIAARKE